MNRFVSITILSTLIILGRLNYFCFNIIGPYGVVLCCYLKRFSFSVNVSFFLATSTTCEKFRRFKYPYSCFFFPFLFLSYFCSVDFYIVSVVSNHCTDLFCPFSCNLWIVVLIRRRYLQCWRVLFHFLFLIHKVCQCHLCDVRPWASSLVFLTTGLFV